MKIDSQLPQAFFQHLDVAWRTHFGERVKWLLVDYMSAFQVACFIILASVVYQ